MVYISPLGRNWGSTVNWDFLGELYASIAIAWTAILYAGALWLYIHRRKPHLKIRNIPLAIAAVSFLHVYLVKILLAYTTNGHFPCSAEFWIMSIYLPFGIALSQANVVQLLDVSTQQRKLLEGNQVSIQNLRRDPWSVRGLGIRSRGLSPLKQTYVLIGVGMVIQAVVTAAIYGTNGKLQGHWGNIAKSLGQARCRKGLEWIPSAMWQLFFCCLYGPYLLYRIRNVRDTHFWRIQVVCCVISGFPGAPLWIAAVFSPTFKPVNKYWVPPMWLAPGIIVIQAITIFFPIYEDYRCRRLSARTLAMLSSSSANRVWEESSAPGTANSRSTSSATSSPGKPLPSPARTYTNSPSTPSSDSSLRRSQDAFSLSALEATLASNPAPLLHFAATKDFTAESIIFLLAIRNWHLAWNSSTVSGDMLWRQARNIYIHSVSDRTADFPINIDSGIKGRLDAVFERSLKQDSDSGGVELELGRERSIVSPFMNESADKMPLSPMKTNWAPVSESSLEQVASSTGSRAGGGKGVWGERLGMGKEEAQAGIPQEFNEHVFDAAEKSIKYLVVTNTWRKFVSEGRSSQEGMV